MQILALMAALRLEREQAFCPGGLREHGDKLRIDDGYLVKLSAQIALRHQIADGEAVRNRDAGSLGKLGRQNFDPLAVAEIHGTFADGQDACRKTVLHLLCHSLDDVAVVAAGETTVTRNHDQTALFDLALLLIRRDEVAGIGLDIQQRLLEPRKIRTAVLLALLGFSELGGGDEFHRFGDLHGALNAADAQLDILHGCASHHLPPPFSYLARKSFVYCLSAAASFSSVSFSNLPVVRMVSRISACCSSRRAYRPCSYWETFSTGTSAK